VPVDGTDLRKRIKIYAGINEHKTIEDRKKHAETVIASLDIYNYHRKEKQQPQHTILHEAIQHKYLRKSGVKHYETHLHNFLEWFKKLPEACTVEDAKRFIDHLLSKGLNNTTVNHYKTSLRTLYKYAVEKNYLPDNPFREIKKLPENKQSKMYFTDAQVSEIKQYLAKHDEELWLACSFIYYCFIRPNELRQLQIQHVDFYRMKIKVPGLIAKNGKTQIVEIPKPFQDKLLVISKRKPAQYLLGNGNDMLGTNNLSKRFRKALDSMGYDHRYSLYSFKHTGALKFVTHTKDIKALQLQLRHHSLDMVNEYLNNMGAIDNDEVRNNFPAI
jgi:integrase